MNDKDFTRMVGKLADKLTDGQVLAITLVALFFCLIGSMIY